VFSSRFLYRVEKELFVSKTTLFETDFPNFKRNMNECDIENIFGDLLNRLPLSSDGNESITLSAKNLPVLPSVLETENIYLKKGVHSYSYNFMVDILDFHARKDFYRCFGLLIFSVIFHPQPTEVLIKLKHPQSDIVNLIVENQQSDLDNLCAGYHSIPYAFEYYPALTHRHPFDKCIAPRGLPCFGLTNLEDFVVSDDDLKKRDTVRVFGSDKGMSLFAELLLNAALPENTENEYALEGESGFRGVGASSAEVRLFLPGHEFWFDEHWQTSI
jgi:hypothetical protein